jgi:hypothetical protein
VVGFRVQRQRVLGAFQRRGWLAVAAPSGGPIDLICMKGGRTVIVRCVPGASATYRDVRPFLEAAWRAGVEPVLAFAVGRRIRLVSASSWSDFVP